MFHMAPLSFLKNEVRKTEIKFVNLITPQLQGTNFAIFP